MEIVKRYRWWLFAIILAGAMITLFERWRTWKENSQDEPILAAAQKYGVDPALVKAVVWRESRFNPKVRGDAGELGLMQVGALAAQEWASAEGRHVFQHRQLIDPVQNTLAGTWYLHKCLRRYAHTDNPPAYALADYNAGRTRVLRWNKGAASTNSTAFLGQMDYPGTRRYVQSILMRYKHYQKTFPPRKKSVAAQPSRARKGPMELAEMRPCGAAGPVTNQAILQKRPRSGLGRPLFPQSSVNAFNRFSSSRRNASRSGSKA